jgi:hypothetical protein
LREGVQVAINRQHFVHFKDQSAASNRRQSPNKFYPGIWRYFPAYRGISQSVVPVFHGIFSFFGPVLTGQG